jgi:hypothetical protein
VTPDRRTLVVVAVALAVAAPAAVLRAMCVGAACRAEPVRATVPFCSLPDEVRGLLAAGFRDGRGPHVMAVAGGSVVGGTAVGLPILWPTPSPSDGTVPLVFAGEGVAPGADVPGGTTLDSIAPTVAQAIRLDRPHPGVRSGRSLPGVADPASRPRLVMVVAWEGVGTDDLRARPNSWPNLRALRGHGAGTLRAEAGSLPLDPAAVLTTIGTGGLPRDHGITGTLVRNDRGKAVRAWSSRAPYSVIAGLGDDLDRRLGQRPRVGAVLTHISDRGIIGGTWYVDGDRDDVVVRRDGPMDQARAAAHLLRTGYGRDHIPDLLGVVMAGPVRRMDRALGRLVEAAERASKHRVLTVVVSTGPGGHGIDAAEIEDQVEARLGQDVIEATAPGGLFLNQSLLASTGLPEDPVIRALRTLPDPDDGGRLLADVFPQVAVTFARFC